MDPSLERYSRQMRFGGIGEAGQRKLAQAHVTLCGCGALGTVLANVLVRAGVGHLRLVDRDFIETHNLQRQVLFDEHDVAENLPKAEAAARKLGAINSAVHVEPVVADIDRTNILDLVRDADVILDGTDNFEIRYLINDVAVKLNKPWVYGGSIGSHGQTMTILPGETPCLRCVFEAAPAPGEAGTCETAGVLSPVVNIVASFQAAEALKILTGQRERVSRELLYVDVWENQFRRIKIAPLLGKVDCPCCQRRRFEWLEGEHGSHTTSLCG
jgi:molybdopterin-synthase adenylyltransferase